MSEYMHMYMAAAFAMLMLFFFLLGVEKRTRFFAGSLMCSHERLLSNLSTDKLNETHWASKQGVRYGYINQRLDFIGRNLIQRISDKSRFRTLASKESLSTFPVHADIDISQGNVCQIIEYNVRHLCLILGWRCATLLASFNHQRVSLLCRQWYLNNIVSACCLHQSAPCAEHLQCALAHFSSVRARWCVKRDGHSTLTMMSGWCCCYHWSRDWWLLILISASLRWIYKNVARTLVGQVQFVDSSACSIKKLL